jgi:hypothetical protein
VVLSGVYFFLGRGGFAQSVIHPTAPSPIFLAKDLPRLLPAALPLRFSDRAVFLAADFVFDFFIKHLPRFPPL